MTRRILKRTAGALAIAVAVLLANTACTIDDAEEPPQPVIPATEGILITVGAGIVDDVTPTRSVVVPEDGKRALHFTDGDRLYVYGNLPEGYYLAGTLDIDASTISPNGKSADFSGSFKVYNASNEDVTKSYTFTDPSDPLADCVSTTAHLFHKEMKADIYTIQADHTLIYNTAQAFAYDVETLMTTVLEVSGSYNSSTKRFLLGSTDAILYCTLSGLAASTSYKVKFNSDDSPVATYDFTTDADGIGTIAFVASDGSHARSLNILQSDGTTLVGNIGLGTRDFTAKVYNVQRYWLDPKFVSLKNLSNLNNYTASDGEVLTGILGGGATNTGNVKIAAGATVVLHNVEISSVDKYSGKQYAGIDCQGDATIVLSGTNKVKGGAAYKPAIYIPQNKTLTIRGNGSLEADGTGCGAGIGGGEIYDCGNIVIDGGHVTAKAGTASAAVGSGYSRSCGIITLSGGTVIASSTGTGAAIGSGDTGSCGTISISGGSVTANSSNFGAAIGSGYNLASCDIISISGGTVTATSTSLGAGIGSGKSSGCTGISITGGTVEAEGTYGAGIGSGSDSGTTCGDITITSDVTSVTARKTGATCSIGKGYGASCGTVTIGGVAYPDGITASPYTYQP